MRWEKKGEIATALALTSSAQITCTAEYVPGKLRPPSSVFSALGIAEYVPGNYRSLAPGLHHSTEMGMIDRGAELSLFYSPV